MRTRNNEVFTLLLNSEKTIQQGGFVLDSTTNSDVQYQIDFDALFQGKNLEYKYAQLRGAIITEKVGVSPLPNTIGFISVVGFAQKNTLGTTSAPVVFSTLPSTDNFGGVNGYYFPGFRSTLFTYEAYELCTIPQGIQNIRVQFTSLTDAIQAGGTIGNYNLVLQFELYN